MAAQSIVEHLSRDRSNLSAAVSWSQAAAGNLQVLQAGNQIQALVATQLMRLQQLSAASQRAQAAELAQQAAARDASRANADRLMQCFTCMAPTQPLNAPPTLGFGR
jgi:P-type conjugative transfer protein TrbJ